MSKRVPIPTTIVRKARCQAYIERPLAGKLKFFVDNRNEAGRIASELARFLFHAPCVEETIEMLRDVERAHAADALEIEAFVAGRPHAVESWTAAILRDEGYGVAASVNAAWSKQALDEDTAKSRARQMKRAREVRHRVLAATGRRAGSARAGTDTTDPNDVRWLVLGVAVDLPVVDAKPEFVDELSERRALKARR